MRTSDQFAVSWLASDQFASDQFASDQFASDQFASDQFAASHAPFERAAVVQASLSKTGIRLPPGSGTTNGANARSRSGAVVSPTARAALGSPTPSDSGVADGVARAVAISAPLT